MSLSFLSTSKASSVRQEFECLLPAVSLFTPESLPTSFLGEWIIWYVLDLWAYCVVAWWLDRFPKLLGDLVKR